MTRAAKILEMLGMSEHPITSPYMYNNDSRSVEFDLSKLTLDNKDILYSNFRRSFTSSKLTKSDIIDILNSGCAKLCKGKSDIGSHDVTVKGIDGKVKVVITSSGVSTK